MVEELTLKKLSEIKHDYYASGSNFYSNECNGHWNTWADFYENYINADIDMNLIYRWDISEREKSGRFRMQIIIISQRKGIYIPHHIDYVDDKDLETMIPLLKKHFEKLIQIWSPLSDTKEIVASELQKDLNDHNKRYRDTNPMLDGNEMFQDFLQKKYNLKN